MKREYDSTLEYKRHDQEFYSINEEIRSISRLSVLARQDSKSIRLYFYRVNSLFIIYSEYCENTLAIETELNKIEILLYSSNYLKELKKETKNHNVIMFETSIIKRIDKVFKVMCSDFVKVELRPKPVKTPKKWSQITNDPEKRQQYLALEEIGIM